MVINFGTMRVACALVVLGMVGCGTDAHGAAATGGTGGAAGFSGFGGTGGYGSVGGFGGASGIGGVGGTGGLPPGSTPLPCDVGKVIADNCQGCHAATPMFGAPMSLMSWEDVTRAITWPNEMRPAGMAAGAVVGLEMHRRVNDTPQSPMPPLTVTNQLDASEKAILNAWLGSPSAGYVGQVCNTQPTGGAGGIGGASGIGGVGGTAGIGGVGGISGEGGVGGTAGVGGTGAVGECEESYEFRAHGVGQPGDTTPYNVSQNLPSGNKYECFHFNAPWGNDTVLGTNFIPITGDTRTLHHWILYGKDSANGSNGSIGNCGDKGYFVQGWAPGGEEAVLPADVGMQMPKGASASFTLEVHYNNASRVTDSTDRSGVRVCVTRTPRTHTAAVHWLGTENIGGLQGIGPGQGGTATGTCDPSGSTPATILSVSPHMHQMGTHMTTVITRAGGGTEMLHDGAFQFANQIDYPKTPPVIINPGDTLRTTCTYQNSGTSSIRFGPNTEDEMCYNFVLAYPVGSLASASGNRCTSLF